MLKGVIPMLPTPFDKNKNTIKGISNILVKVNELAILNFIIMQMVINYVS